MGLYVTHVECDLRLYPAELSVSQSAYSLGPLAKRHSNGVFSDGLVVVRFRIFTRLRDASILCLVRVFNVGSAHEMWVLQVCVTTCADLRHKSKTYLLDYHTRLWYLPLRRAASLRILATAFASMEVEKGSDHLKNRAPVPPDTAASFFKGHALIQKFCQRGSNFDNVVFQFFIL